MVRRRGVRLSELAIARSSRFMGSRERVVFVHGSPGWGEDSFPEQGELADEFEVHLIDRRGYPDNPPSKKVGFGVDAHDLAQLVGDGAHLVGHSYGGVGCLLAAAMVPKSVLSLTVIEPAAYSVARGHPAIEEIIQRMQSMFYAPQESDPAMAYRNYLEAFDAAVPEPLTLTPRDVRSIEALLVERPAWEATIPLERLGVRSFPIAVVSGAYGEDNDSSRARARHEICDRLVQALGAEAKVFENGYHAPQVEVPKEFNLWLRGFLRRASDTTEMS